MSWSLGETRALAVKAARGAGMAWGLAAEAGFAVHWLQIYGAPGVRTLADYLIWCDGRDCATAPVWTFINPAEPGGVFCPIALGAAISDAQLKVPARLGYVRQPLLIVPFIAAASVLHGARRLLWQDTEIMISQNGFTTSVPQQVLLIEQAECDLAEGAEFEPVGPQCLRVPETEAASMAVLEKFAARTYAPLSEQSRLTGAGAGLIDDD